MLRWKALLGLTLAAAAGAALLLGLASGPLALPPTDQDIERNILAELRAVLTAETLRTKVHASFEEGDIESVDLYLQAAALIDLPVDHAIRSRFDVEMAAARKTMRAVKDCAAGAVTGRATTLEGIACSIAFDLTVVGDIRDIGFELAKRANGEEGDHLVLGLATAGLALTAAGLATGGAPAGAKVGTSVLKVGAKSAIMSRRLIAETASIANRGVSISPLTKLSRADLQDAGKLRQAVRQAVDVEKLRPLTEAAETLSQVQKRGSIKDSLMVLRTAEKLEDIASAGRVSRVFGTRTAAVLKAVGPRAFHAATRLTRIAYKTTALIAGFGFSVLAALFGILLAGRSAVSTVLFFRRAWLGNARYAA